MLISLRPIIILSGKGLQFPCSDMSSVLGVTAFPAQFASVTSALISQRSLRVGGHESDYNIPHLPSACTCQQPRTLHCSITVLCTSSAMLDNNLSLHSSAVQISPLSQLDRSFIPNVLDFLFMCVFDNYTPVRAPKWIVGQLVMVPVFPSFFLTLVIALSFRELRAPMMNSQAC